MGRNVGREGSGRVSERKFGEKKKGLEDKRKVGKWGEIEEEKRDWIDGSLSGRHSGTAAEGKRSSGTVGV